MAIGWAIGGFNKTTSVARFFEGKQASTQTIRGEEFQRVFMPTDTAARYVRNYLAWKGGLSKKFGNENSKFFYIRVDRLVQMINEWNGGQRLKIDSSVEQKVDLIRIYPMIYAKNHPLISTDSGQINVQNKLNLCLVPVLGNSEILTNFNGKYGYFYFNSIQNQIGQCPPGTCSTELLDYIDKNLSKNPDSQ